MSPIPDPHTQLKPYAGAAALERPVVELAAGVWAGRVVVRHRELRSRRTARAFSVEASWTGPPMSGFPQLPAIADRQDTLILTDLELAKAVAMAATDELRASRVPDLRALAKRFKPAK